MLPDRIANWNDFFRMKGRIKWLQRLFGGVPSVAMFMFVETNALSLPIFNPTAPIMGVDPVLAVGASTVIGASASYLLGSMLFRMAHQAWKPELHAEYVRREGEYAKRVAGHRANVPPSPVQLSGTDFYGESVKSVAGYRRC